MKFQIIDNETKQAISLKDFDLQYTTFCGIENNSRLYSLWFSAMEGILLLHADLADNAYDSYLVESKIGIKKSDRKLSFKQAARLLLINDAYWLEFDEVIWKCVEFFKAVEDKYYIEYSI